MHVCMQAYRGTATCKIIGTGSTAFNGFLYQITTGKPLKRLPIILQVTVCACIDLVSTFSGTHQKVYEWISIYYFLLRIHVCVRACVRACVYEWIPRCLPLTTRSVCVYMCINVCMYVICIHVYERISRCLPIKMHSVCMCMCINVCMYVTCIYVYVCMCMYAIVHDYCGFGAFS